MSLWQWQVALNGYVEAHSSKQNTLSEAERDELYDWLSRDAAPLVLTTQTYRLSDEGNLEPAGVITFTPGL